MIGEDVDRDDVVVGVEVVVVDGGLEVVVDLEVEVVEVIVVVVEVVIVDVVEGKFVDGISVEPSLTFLTMSPLQHSKVKF